MLCGGSWWLIAAALIIIIMAGLFGCKTENRRAVINGKPYEITAKKFMGLTLWESSEPTKTQLEVLRELLREPAKQANRIGLFTMLIGTGIALAFQSPYLSAISRKAALVGLTMWAGSLPILFIVNWITWVLLGVAVLAGGYWIHRSSDFGLDDLIRKKVSGKKLESSIQQSDGPL